MAARQWDMEADVVVAGFGYAGGIAAVAAVDAGLRPLVIEKQPFPGGISITAGGGVAVATDEEKCFRYLKRTNLNTSGDGVLRALAKGMVELPAYIRYLEKWSAEREGMRVIMNSGGEGTYRFEGADGITTMKIAIVKNEDAGKVYEFPGFPWAKGLRGGARLFKLVYDNVQARKVPVQYNTAAASLVQGDRGEIIGVVATERQEKGEEKTIRIRARRGVVLATGGFEFNEDLKLQYFWGQPVYGITATANTGDGIRMAQAVGAELWHMWHFHGGYGFKFDEFPFAFRHRVGGPRLPNRKMPWILLDKYGRRFMNEYPPCVQDTGARALLEYNADRAEFPRIPATMIFDEEGRKIGQMAVPIFQGDDYSYEWSEDNLKEVERGWIKRAESIEELARQLGLPEGTVRDTIDRWNQGCREGKDPDFGRLSGTMMSVDHPPFYWVEVWPVVSNTQGGPVHDEHQRVIKVNGQPVPRLYAVGECGSVFGHLYLESANISECFIGGRNAVSHMLTLPEATRVES